MYGQGTVSCEALLQLNQRRICKLLFLVSCCRVLVAIRSNVLRGELHAEYRFAVLHIFRGVDC